MIVVSDTTPLNYLVLIRAIDLLPQMFAEVYIPSAVIQELLHAMAPAPVRAWAGRPPSWLHIANPAARLPSTARLDAGEGDAISLARERGIQDILIDEKAGRRIAQAEGLFVLPTITLLERADELRLLDFAVAIQSLRTTTFRAPADKIAAALQRVAARRRTT